MPNLPNNIVAAAQKVGITFPIPLPLYDSPPNQGHLEEWAKSQLSPKLRDIAHKIAANVKHVPQNEFLSALQNTVSDFTNQTHGESFVLLLGEGKGPKQKTLGSSDQWMIGLALEHCGLPAPTDIITVEELPTFLAQHPQVSNILMLDDASYSGGQKCLLMNNIEEVLTNQNLDGRLDKLTLYMGMPYMTARAKEFITENRAKDSAKLNMTFLEHQILPTMTDILDPDEVAFLHSVGTEHIDNMHTITYFDHKFADEMSCFHNIYNGKPLFNPDKLADLLLFLGYVDKLNLVSQHEDVKLVPESEYWDMARELLPNYDGRPGYNIPTIIPPYKLRDFRDRLALESAIVEGRIGQRNDVPPSSPDIAKVLNTKSQGDVAGYTKGKPLSPEIEPLLDIAIKMGLLGRGTASEIKRLIDNPKAQRNLRHD